MRWPGPLFFPGILQCVLMPHNKAPWTADLQQAGHTTGRSFGAKKSFQQVLVDCSAGSGVAPPALPSGCSWKSQVSLLPALGSSAWLHRASGPGRWCGKRPRCPGAGQSLGHWQAWLLLGTRELPRGSRGSFLRWQHGSILFLHL